VPAPAAVAAPPTPSPPIEVAARPVDTAKRPARHHRRAVAYSAQRDLMMPAFMQPGPPAAPPARGAQPALVAPRPFFSR